MASDLAGKYNVSRESILKLENYVKLLLRWQARINLIGPATEEDVWQRHIADSMQLGPLIKNRTKSARPVIIDLGTGAGLPGIPLAISLGAFVHLVESTKKKAAFLREAIRVTGIDAMVHNCRIEAIDSDMLRPHPDIVTSRALAPLGKLFEFAEPWIEKGAIGMFMKGQHVDNELTQATKCWSMNLELVPSPEKTGGTIVIVKNLQAKHKNER
jgi:16S rRNA (guanine527-N7)-methyltransferase